MRWFHWTLLVLLLVGGTAAGGSLALNELLNAPMPVAGGGEGAEILQVEPGDNLRKVLREIKHRGWIEYPRLVEWWARHQRLDQGLHIGEYRITPGTSAAALVQMINAGEVIRYSITLPEGISLANALERLQSDTRLKPLLSGPDDDRLLALVAPSDSAEGWFMPETYQFTRGDSDLDILTRAHTAMESALTVAWESRAPNLPLRHAYEALILASVVERETSIPEERPAIAGVFLRRLQRNMRLQTDPTVIYGLGDQYRGNLTRKHLRDTENPWNTYVIKGLPPTPIALPGVAALQAAVQPAPGEDLYFVARGDGYHAFAATLEEHNANVKRYQLSRRADYRSTPDERP